MSKFKPGTVETKPSTIGSLDQMLAILARVHRIQSVSNWMASFKFGRVLKTMVDLDGRFSTCTNLVIQIKERDILTLIFAYD